MPSQNKDELRFGVDINAQLQEWWTGEYLPAFRKRYGAEADVVVVVLDPATRGDYDSFDPLEETLHELATAPWVSPDIAAADDPLYGSTGLLANVAGKMQFVLRTGEDSVVAEGRPDLVEPGDFPHEGAGTYRGYTGGASGLVKESDWRVFRDVVGKLIELRAAAAQPALNRARNRRPGDKGDVKYLDGLWVVGDDGVARMQGDDVDDPRAAALVDTVDQIPPR